ncbi:MAG: class F sortase [Patescibacteria group bacterium]
MRVRTIAAIAITAVAVVVFATTFSGATLYSAPDEVTVGAAQAILGAAVPTRLRIPALGVDAHVQQVGVAKSGNLAVPTNFTDVGWYRAGPKPGEAGSAVVDGHVDNGLGVPAVFKNVQNLNPGDEILIDNASGTLRFVVQSVAVYPRKEVPLQQLFHGDGVPRLNLITCEGEWLADQKTYDHRVVVYAVLAG